jgi:membrane protein DedA with SNARE-associated domain
MSFTSFHQLDGLFAEYGYAVIFFGIMLESIGLPLPGESLMIAAALYAATTHRLSILELVPVAAAGAIIGDQIGYFVGRWIGVRYLTEWGR